MALLRSFWHPFRPLLFGWLISALGCGVISLALGWQMSRALSLPDSEMFQLVGRDWIIWSFAIPLIFRFVERSPFDRKTWRLALPLHALVYLILLASVGWLGHVPHFNRDVTPGASIAARTSLDANKPPKPLFATLFLGPHFPLYLTVLSGAHALAFYRRVKEREIRAAALSASLAETKLQALRTQIQPHFLFNALNGLGGLIHRDPDTADEMLAAICDFLRLSLDGPAEQTVPLRRELDLLERYLTIEKMRFGPRLAYDLAPADDTLAAHVPTLMLQPLVENAIRHGIEPKQAEGTVTIRARREGNELHLSVADNGVGLSAQVSERIGLGNTRSRLRELYNDRARLDIRSDRGTVVTIVLPFLTA